MHAALLQSPLRVSVRKGCAGVFFPLFSSTADLFMNLGMCGFEVKPGDAMEKEANGDKTPPVGLSGRTAAPIWDYHHYDTNQDTQRR